MSSKITTKRNRELRFLHEGRAVKLRFALDRLDTMLEELEIALDGGNDPYAGLKNCQRVVNDAIKSDDNRLRPEALKAVKAAVAEAQRKAEEAE